MLYLPQPKNIIKGNNILKNKRGKKVRCVLCLECFSLLFDIYKKNSYNIGSKLIPIYKGENMENTAQTAKQKAEAKFKQVGTKLKEQDFHDFERLYQERGFENGSKYIKHLIEFDTLGDIEEERKQNAILTENIAIYKAEIKELRETNALFTELVKAYDGKLANMDENIAKLYAVMNKIGDKIVKDSEAEGKTKPKEKKGFFDAIKGFFGIGGK